METTPHSPTSHGFVAPTPELLAPHFPQLEILELLGQGGMGAVYKARQPRLDRMVAVKILPRESAVDPAFAERFTREAKALARLSHPHIVTVYDFGEAAGLFFFVMEYVDGLNLRQMQRAGQLSPGEALAVVPQICEALQYAHDEGIVHRDIKPENILVDQRGRVKIADFGLAKLLGQVRADFTLTGTQQVVGTPQYMAPEQIETPQHVDHRADIYSLGVVFYEMLTGELPIGRFEPPSHRVQVDVRLDDVVLKSLEKRPERRYQHASDVKTDLEAVGRSSAHVRSETGDHPAPHHGPSQRPTLQVHLRGWTAARPLFWPGVGLLVAALVDAFFVYAILLGNRDSVPFQKIPEGRLDLFIYLGLPAAIVSALRFVGGIVMLRTEKLRAASMLFCAAMVGLWPVSPGSLISAPLSIWALAKMTKAALADPNAERALTRIVASLNLAAGLLVLWWTAEMNTVASWNSVLKAAGLWSTSDQAAGFAVGGGLVLASAIAWFGRRVGSLLLMAFSVGMVAWVVIELRDVPTLLTTDYLEVSAQARRGLGYKEVTPGSRSFYSEHPDGRTEEPSFVSPQFGAAGLASMCLPALAISVWTLVVLASLKNRARRGDLSSRALLKDAESPEDAASPTVRQLHVPRPAVPPRAVPEHPLRVDDSDEAQRRAELAETPPGWLGPLALLLFAVGWVFLGAMWNFRLPGLIVGFAVMAAIVHTVLCWNLNYLPNLRAELARQSVLRRGVALVWGAAILAFGMFCVFVAQLTAWESFSNTFRPDWLRSMPLSASGTQAIFSFSLDKLAALRQMTPTDLSVNYTASRYGNLAAAWGQLANILLFAFLALVCVFAAAQAVIDTRRYRGTWKNSVAPSLNISLLVVPTIILVHFVRLMAGFTTAGFPLTEVHPSATFDQMGSAIEAWAKGTGYNIEGDCAWRIASTKSGEMGRVRMLELKASSPFDRYRFAGRFVVRPLPTLRIKYVSVDESPESYMSVDLPAITKDSQEELLWPALLDSLKTAVNKSPAQPRPVNMGA